MGTVVHALTANRVTCSVKGCCQDGTTTVTHLVESTHRKWPNGAPMWIEALVDFCPRHAPEDT